MALAPGRYALGPHVGRVLLRTSRAGLASRLGHDLLLSLTEWSGELDLSQDGGASTLDLELDLRSLVVLEGTGGIAPLSEEDRRLIRRNALQALAVRAYPVARFGTSASGHVSAGGTLQGTLAMRGRSRPLRVHVEQLEEGSWRATTTVRQSDFGIEPYTAFLGALRLADEVGVEAEATLPLP